MLITMLITIDTTINAGVIDQNIILYHIRNLSITYILYLFSFVVSLLLVKN